jgi:hypothetical protein
MTQRSDFKQIVRARMVETNERYTVAARAIEEQRLEDPTAIVSGRVNQELRRAWPGLRVDLVVGGLFAADEPTPARRTYRSHLLHAHVPTSIGPMRTEIEVRTAERRRGTSQFRVYAWIDGDDGETLDRRLDLLSRADVDAFARDVMELVRRRVGAEPGAPVLRFFSVYCDYATSTRAGAAGTFQVISLNEGDADVIHLVDQGVHYHGIDELRRDISKALRVDIKDIVVEEVEEADD